MYKGKTIFIAPLDWGLGHATRCVPIIKHLVKNNTVILGVTPLTKIILNEEFPLLEQVEMPAYNIRYSKTIPLWLNLAFSYFKISKIIETEHALLEKLIAEKKLDIIISDNRFGLYSPNAHCVFITHQLFLKAPIFQSIAQRINKNYILKFNEVWVPDYKDTTENLSGDLSHQKQYHNNVKYIGPQSRLKELIVTTEKNKFNLLVLLSGPEPQRSSLEELLLEKLKSYKGKVAFVRGSASKRNLITSDNIIIIDFPNKEVLSALIMNSERIICRSGYSTLMDLHVLEKKDLLLIPTPGQSEQEYLAKYWKEKFGVEVCPQNEVMHLKLIC